MRLSVSVRGIGLTLFECIARVLTQIPDIECPVHSLYRVSLLQFAAKYVCIHLGGEIGFSEPLPNEFTTILTSDVRDVVKMNPIMFTPVSGIINCLGRFSVQNNRYFPSFLKTLSPSSFSIISLRELVTLLADPNTPIDVRRRYIDLNSIPGAQFHDEEEPILVNADEIIPADYDLATMRMDMLRVKGYLARVGRKIPKLIGTVTFDTKGNAGQLLTTELHGASPRIWSFVDWAENQFFFVFPLYTYRNFSAL